MFDNIGAKIKRLAKILCWVGIAASFILAIIMFVSAEEGSYSTEGMYRGFGLAFLFIGPLASWVSSFFIYGFGELIETNCELARNTRNICAEYAEKLIEDEYKSGKLSEEDYNRKRNEVFTKYI